MPDEIHFIDDKPAASLRSVFSPRRIALGIGACAVCFALAAGVLRYRAYLDELARAFHCENQLRQIGVALEKYQSDHGKFPPAVTYDPSGKAWHSWRALILPYLENGKYAGKYRYDEPWDGPNNVKLIPQMPPAYAIQSARTGGPGLSNVRTFVGPSAILRPIAPVTTVAGVTDGTSSTVSAFESSLPVPWTKPEEPSMDVPGLSQLVGVGRPGGGFLALFADGSVKYLPGGLDDQTIRSLMTRDGKEVVNPSALSAPAGPPPAGPR